MDLIQQLLAAARSEFVYLTGDGIICKEACYLTGIVASNVGAASESMTLHGGQSESGPTIALIDIYLTTPFSFTPLIPIFCPTGLYVNFESTNIKATFLIIQSSQLDAILEK